MTIDEMILRKKELGYSDERLAELSGVPAETVRRIFGGSVEPHRDQTLRALEKVLEKVLEKIPGAAPEKEMEEMPGAAPIPVAAGEKEVDGSGTQVVPAAGRSRNYPESGAEGVSTGFFRYAAPVYQDREEKKYTIDDYYAFKDEKRSELIDGKFYVMEAPSIKHQIIIGELYILFRECIRLHGKKCRVILSPCDVQLDADKYTMVQPDLLIVCDEEKTRTRVCMGAPDLLVEVMSASSRSRDAVLKLNKYTRAGVREYWLVDPENNIVIVYTRDGTDEGEWRCRQYSFADMIPVGISGGECIVDFSVVPEAVRGLA